MANIAIFYHPTGSKFQTVVPRDRIPKKTRSKGSRDLIAETNSFAFENRPFQKDILLMVQKSGDHQLRLVVYPIFKGFHTSQVG